MNKTTVTVKEDDTATRERTATAAGDSNPKLDWETPRMEDVSEQVTAQPYIRFT